MPLASGSTQQRADNVFGVFATLLIGTCGTNGIDRFKLAGDDLGAIDDRVQERGTVTRHVRRRKADLLRL